MEPYLANIRPGSLAGWTDLKTRHRSLTAGFRSSRTARPHADCRETYRAAGGAPRAPPRRGGLPVISSAIFRRISMTDPIAIGASVAKKAPVSERFTDSALRSVGPDFQTRTCRAVLNWSRRVERRSAARTSMKTSSHQGGVMARNETCVEEHTLKRKGCVGKVQFSTRPVGP